MDETLDLQDCLPKVTTICQGCYQKMIFNRSILYAIKYPEQAGGSILVGTPEQLNRNPEIQAINATVKAILDAYKQKKSTLSIKTLSHNADSSKDLPKLRGHDSSQMLSQSVRKFPEKFSRTLKPSFLSPSSDSPSMFGTTFASGRLRYHPASASSLAKEVGDEPSSASRRPDDGSIGLTGEPLSVDDAIVLLNDHSSSCSQQVLHPLCKRCAETRSLAIDSALRCLHEEIFRYKNVFTPAFSSQPTRSSSSSSSSLPSKSESQNSSDDEFSWLEGDEEKLDKELNFYLGEEKRLRDELLMVSTKRQNIKHKISQLKQSTKHLKELERKYWKNYNRQRDIMTEQCIQMRDQYTTLKWKTQRLNFLCHSVVLDDAFRIGHSGFLGTVNDMRLGKLPSVPIDWAEINCAWGYIALLLNGIAKAMPDVQFGSKIMLVGSTPYIVQKDYNVLNLFNDGKIFGTKRLDEAVAEVLKIVNCMSEYCSRNDKDFFFPYVIGTDKVGKFPIKFQSKDDIGLSEGMKCLLTDIKFILNWIVPRFKRRK